jgi:hypothetical protein
VLAWPTVSWMPKHSCRSWISLLVLSALVLASACSVARVRVQTELRAVDSRELNERVQLGHVGGFGELADGQVRARVAARLAARLGNADEASAFAREQLDLARTTLLLVRIANGPEAEFERAIAELDEAATFAVELGDEVVDARLVVEAAQFMLAPKRHRKPIARALGTVSEADLSWGYARLWDAFAKHPSMLAALQRLRWRGHRSPGLPHGSPRLAPASLAAAGSEAVDLLWTEADRAATENRSADYVRWIDAILEADRWNPNALAAKAMRDALERGELLEDPALLPDLATNTADPLGGQARMLVRQREVPKSRALALFRANDMLAHGGFGDAGELLASLGKGGTPIERQLFSTLEAMVGFESGTAVGRREFEQWRRQAGAKRSASLSEYVSNFEQDTAPAGHVELARSADRELVTQSKGRNAPRLPLPVLGSAAIDALSSERARGRALYGVAGRDPELGAKLAICRERKLFDEDCREVLDELEKLDQASPEYGAGLDALDAAANTRASWFASVAWLEDDQLPAVRERLLRYEGTRVAATTNYQAAILMSELAGNRPDLARARLQQSGAILRPETRAIAAMALEDLEDGLVEPRQLSNLLLELPSADVDAAWFLERDLPGDPSTIEALFPGRSRLARFARGLALARMGAWTQASAELVLTVEELDGVAKGVVAGRLALVAALSGQTVLRDRALAIADAEDALGFMAPFVRARVAEDALDRATAHGLYLRALARRPQALPALEGALRTLEIRDRDLERVRDVLLLFPDSSVHWFASELLDAAARDEIDGPLLTHLWLARDDADKLLGIGEPSAKIPVLAERGLERLLAELQAAPSPAEAFPLAAKILAWLGASPPELRVEYRNLEMWLTYMIGRDSELEALTLARPHYQGFVQPAALTHATLLLAEARKHGVVDDTLSWAIVRDELWNSDDPMIRVQLGDLYGPIEDTALAQYACLRMFRRDEYEIAAERCAPLWTALGGSPFLAVDLAYLALNDPDLMRANGLDIAEFFATAEQLPRLEEDPVWLLNASLWASRRGDHQRGAELRVEQLALESISPLPDDIELGQARYRGALLRQQIINQFEAADRRAFAYAAGSAVRSLDLIAAEIYASRLLAWVPTDADPSTAEFTARSPQMLAETRVEGETSDAELRSTAFYVLSMARLIREDLDEKRISREAMYALLDAYAEERGLAEYERIADDHQSSHVAKLILLSEYGEGNMREQALALARELVALQPNEPLVLAEALPLLIGPDDLDASRELLGRARIMLPEHPWLSDDALPSVLTGSEDLLPAWLRTPEAFDAALANVEIASIDALAPKRRANLEVAAEAFFASEIEINENGLGAHQPVPGAAALDPDDPESGPPNRLVFVVREPRASRCEGMGCADPMIADWASRNYSLLWARELELPSGPAIEFVVADGEMVIDSVLIPTGGNLFVLIGASTPDDFAAFLPQLALLRESFRPLDWVIGADTAESLRLSGRALPADHLRLQGRRLLAAVGDGGGGKSESPTCVLDPSTELAKLTGDVRAELLLDLYLGTRTPWQRRALLACTRPDAPEAARLALVSLLDADAYAFEFGRAATQVHHERVLTDARRVLYQDRQPAVSNPALTVSGEQPPFGLLQVIAALPDEHSRALTRELLSMRDARLRALALAASATMDYFGTPGSPVSGKPRTEVASLREVVTAGTATDAVIALHSLMDIPGTENVAAIRSRADKLIREGIADEPTRGLAGDLAWALARTLDSSERQRLEDLAAAVNMSPPDGRIDRAEDTREALEGMVENYTDARARAKKNEPALDDELTTRWVRSLRSRPAPRDPASIAGTPIAELTPGHDWTYVRVGNAGLFATSLEGLLRRIAPANPSDAYLVRALIHDALLQGSFALLGESGGLDLAAPIECVSPKGSEGFACSATVRDRNAVLTTLAARELGDDAGLAVPLSLATEFAGLPLALGSLPVALHPLVESPAEELEPSAAAKLTAERLRMTRSIAGHELEYYATIELHENRMVVDSEHYLFLGDRLIVFSGADMAEQLLRLPPAGTDVLASDPHFGEAKARWRDGVALQAIDFSEDLGLPEVALEVAFDSDGIEFSASTRGDQAKIGSFGDLGRLLPTSPVAAAAIALEPDALREYFDDADDDELARCRHHGSPQAVATPDSPACGLAATDRFPPVELAEAARAVLLGWYPDVGHTLWQSWVLLMPLDKQLTKAMKKAAVPTPEAKAVLEHAGLFWAVREGALIVASTQALAQATLDAPPRPEGTLPQPTFASINLDGQRAAAVVRQLVSGENDRRNDYLRMLATMIGLVDHVEMQGEWAKTGSEQGSVRASVVLNLAESEEELALIDRWLASPEVSNASKLPRRLARDETDRGLRYHIRVDDAEAFARTAVPQDNDRISIEVLGPDELRMTVLPSRAVPSSASRLLTTDERNRMLAPDQLARVSDPEIREIAKTLRVSGDDLATAEAVVAWVHQKVRYEITPTSLDAVEILERGEGDCTEYALLTVTLLRAAGIPAKLQEGMAASGDEMVAHAWVAWHDGTRWREVDPTAGTASVGSGHLELEIVDVLAMISLGRFEVLSIDAIP